MKTHAADLEKIELIKELVAANLDIDRILGVATEARRERLVRDAQPQFAWPKRRLRQLGQGQR